MLQTDSLIRVKHAEIFDEKYIEKKKKRIRLYPFYMSAGIIAFVVLMSMLYSWIFPLQDPTSGILSGIIVIFILTVRSFRRDSFLENLHLYNMIKELSNKSS